MQVTFFLGFRRRGFSLVELLVAVAIVAILAAIALPSMAALVRENRLSVAANALHGAVWMTRSEAIKRNRRVTLCTSVDGGHCAEQVGWHSGWMIFEDGNANAQRDSGEQIIQLAGATSGQVQMIGNAPVRNYLSYIPSGTSRLVTGGLQMGTISVCAEGHGRKLIVSATGRPRIERFDACN